MKAKTFENLIRKVVREEIDYALRREIKTLKEDLRDELKPTILEQEEIVKIKGIDWIYLGLFDICQSLGLPGQVNHPDVLDEIDRCQKLISSKGIAPGSMSTDIDYINKLFLPYYFSSFFFTKRNLA